MSRTRLYFRLYFLAKAQGRVGLRGWLPKVHFVNWKTYCHQMNFILCSKSTQSTVLSVYPMITKMQNPQKHDVLAPLPKFSFPWSSPSERNRVARWYWSEPSYCGYRLWLWFVSESRVFSIVANSGKETVAKSYLLLLLWLHSKKAKSVKDSFNFCIVLLYYSNTQAHQKTFLYENVSQSTIGGYFDWVFTQSTGTMRYAHVNFWILMARSIRDIHTLRTGSMRWSENSIATYM